MQLFHSAYNNSKNDNNRRKGSLAISALLNDVSIDPIQQQQHPLTPNNKYYDQPWINHHHHSATDYFNTINYSPLSSRSSSPSAMSDGSSMITTNTTPLYYTEEPPDLWNHSKTGMHQTNNGNIVVSSLAKAKRKRILPYQYQRLMETFEITDTPSSEIRGQLADELNMTKREVQVWFQNRRAKMSRSKLSSGSGRHHSLSCLQKSSTNEDMTPIMPYRRASENSSTSAAPYYVPVRSIVPRTTSRRSSPKKEESRYSRNDNNNHIKKMVLEAPYQPSTAKKEQKPSAIDLLASAAELMREN